MLNQVILVGKLQSNPTLTTLEDGRVTTNVILEVQRNYMNPETKEYDIDYLPVTLWSGVAENTVEYCKQGSVVGVKARLVVTNGTLEVIAEKITFINSKSEVA